MERYALIENLNQTGTVAIYDRLEEKRSEWMLASDIIEADGKLPQGEECACLYFDGWQDASDLIDPRGYVKYRVLETWGDK